MRRYAGFQLLCKMMLLALSLLLTGVADAASQTRLYPSRIRSWHAPDDKTMIIETHSGEKYRATFLGGHCRSLRYERSVVFMPWGGMGYLDSFSKITFLSPFGFHYGDPFDYAFSFEQICRFKTLEKYQEQPPAT